MTTLARGLAVVLAAGIVAGCVTNSLTATPDATGEATSSSLPSVEPTDATIPATVGGLDVISVERAVELLDSGGLDGRVVAVAGYYGSFQPSCPAPNGYIGPLEGWCSFDAFTDTRDDARLCEAVGTNGMSCHGATATSISPFFMSETSGQSSWVAGGPTGEPVALVLVGHAGDPRQWQCTSGTQGACSKAFVVDRVAWVDGQGLTLEAPETGDHRSGTPIIPKKTLAQIVAGIGVGVDTTTGAPFRAADIATIDPRWNLAGDDVIWLVRSLAQPTTSSADESRPETVWLVVDATGTVIDSQQLQLDPAYMPARVWPIAIVHGQECCASDLFAFVRVVEASDGAVVYDGIVAGGSSGGSADDPTTTTFGGSYGSLPLILPAGRYSVTSWLAAFEAGATGPRFRECASQFTVTPLAEIALNADFPVDAACAFDPKPFITVPAGA